MAVAQRLGGDGREGEVFDELGGLNARGRVRVVHDGLGAVGGGAGVGELGDLLVLQGEVIGGVSIAEESDGFGFELLR